MLNIRLWLNQDWVKNRTELIHLKVRQIGCKYRILVGPKLQADPTDHWLSNSIAWTNSMENRSDTWELIVYPESTRKMTYYNRNMHGETMNITSKLIIIDPLNYNEKFHKFLLKYNYYNTKSYSITDRYPVDIHWVSKLLEPIRPIFFLSEPIKNRIRSVWVQSKTDGPEDWNSRSGNRPTPILDRPKPNTDCTKCKMIWYEIY